MKTKACFFLFVIFLVVFAFSCTPTPIVYDSTPNGDIAFSGDRAIIYADESITILDEVDKGFTKAPNASNPFNTAYTFKRVAQVAPVSIDGNYVQANTLIIEGKTACVAYNTAGATYRGAIQVLDITQPSRPSIIMEIKFRHIDINALYLEGNDRLIFGGAADADNYYTSFAAPAIIGEINLKAPRADAILASITVLESQTVTGIAKYNGKFFVACAAGNGVIKILNDDFSEFGDVANGATNYADFRDIKAYKDGVISLVGSATSGLTAGAIASTTDTSLTFTQVSSFADFNSVEKKSTIEVYGDDTGLLGLSEAGFKAVNLSTGSILFQLNNPSGATGSQVFDANSVSTDGKLVFVANGNYGFRVLDLTGEDFTTAKVLGYYSFQDKMVGPDYYSANAIAFRNNYLLVASGVGGVNIFTLANK